MSETATDTTTRIVWFDTALRRVRELGGNVGGKRGLYEDGGER